MHVSANKNARRRPGVVEFKNLRSGAVKKYLPANSSPDQKKAFRTGKKIFTTNNHYEWSKNRSYRKCHVIPHPHPSPKKRG